MKATLIKRFDGSAGLIVHKESSYRHYDIDFPTPEKAEAYCKSMNITIKLTFGKGNTLLSNNIGVDFNTRDDTDKFAPERG